MNIPCVTSDFSKIPTMQIFCKNEKNIKISEWSRAQCTAHEKKLSKKIIFSKFFLLFIITILQTICMPNFVKIGQFLIFRQFRALCTSKIKNCLILMKFGVHIVWSMVIVKIKKNFEKNYFSDKFFSWAVHCARDHSEILIFFSLLQNITMLGI